MHRHFRTTKAWPLTLLLLAAAPTARADGNVSATPGVFTGVVHLVSRNPALRMGLYIGLVVALAYFAGLTYMLTTSTAERVPFWSVAGGNLLAVGAMAWYLWRRHPRLGISAPLGSEVKPSPHAPGSPGGAPRR